MSVVQYKAHWNNKFETKHIFLLRQVINLLLVILLSFFITSSIHPLRCSLCPADNLPHCAHLHGNTSRCATPVTLHHTVSRSPTRGAAAQPATATQRWVRSQPAHAGGYCWARTHRVISLLPWKVSLLPVQEPPHSCKARGQKTCKPQVRPTALGAAAQSGAAFQRAGRVTHGQPRALSGRAPVVCENGSLGKG